MSRQWFASGVVEAPVQAVFAALLAVGPAAGAHPKPAAPADPDGVLRYEASVGDAGHTVFVEVDPHRHTLAVQGHWWYRGVYAVHECPQGSLIEYRVRNVATRARWAVPLMQRRLPEQMRRDLAALLQTIGQHLNCATHANPDAPH
jgi:hypothetical protein